MCRDSRRGFLRTLLGAPASGILAESFFRAAIARAQSATAPSTLFEIEKVAEHTYVALARPAAMLNCNAVIFEGVDGVTVVDTHSKPSAAAAMAAQIRREITTKPIRYIINTHFHYDHSQGTPALMHGAPRPAVIASATTRRLLEQEGAKRVAAQRETFRRRLDQARTPAERAEVQAFLDEMRAYEPVLPGVTFDDDLALYDGHQELRLLFRGRAHTASDICVYSPQTRMLATGDMVVGFIPGMSDGYPLEWAATLRRTAELGFDTVLPGHGPVQHGRRRFAEFQAYIDEIAEAVSRAKRQGASLPEVQQRVTPGTLKTLAADGFGGFVASATARFRGLAPKEAAASMAEGVRTNVADIYRHA